MSHASRSGKYWWGLPLLAAMVVAIALPATASADVWMLGGPGCSPAQTLVDGTSWTVMGSDLQPGDGWWSAAQGNYTGVNQAGRQCSGAMMYTLSTPYPVPGFAQWSFALNAQARRLTRCRFDAYIPWQFAGEPQARYDFWAYGFRNGQYVSHEWIGWPGRLINQENENGAISWTHLSVDGSPNEWFSLDGLDSVSVSLNVNGAGGWDLGVGAMKVICQPLGIITG